MRSRFKNQQGNESQVAAGALKHLFASPRWDEHTCIRGYIRKRGITVRVTLCQSTRGDCIWHPPLWDQAKTQRKKDGVCDRGKSLGKKETGLHHVFTVLGEYTQYISGGWQSACWQFQSFGPFDKKFMSWMSLRAGHRHSSFVKEEFNHCYPAFLIILKQGVLKRKSGG